jgi:hypothetical protein
MITAGKGKKTGLKICEQTETFKLIDHYPHIDFSERTETFRAMARDLPLGSTLDLQLRCPRASPAFISHLSRRGIPGRVGDVRRNARIDRVRFLVMRRHAAMV